VDRAAQVLGFRAAVAIERGLTDYVAWIRDGMPSRVPAAKGGA
jgi:nucleoside-diphosphate-sugar epimerase